LHPCEESLAKLREALAASEGKDFPAQLAAEAATEAATGYAALVRSDARSTQALRERVTGQSRFWGCISESEQDVHDLVSLGEIADRIVERKRGIESDSER
jgi:hypothetical protein